MQIRTSAGGASPAQLGVRGRAEARIGAARPTRGPGPGRRGGGGRAREGAERRRAPGRCRGRDPGARAREAGGRERDRQQRCVGSGRSGVDCVTGPGRSPWRPLASRPASRPAPSPLVLCVHRPGTPAGDPLASVAVSSCIQLRHVQTHGIPPAGGGIGGQGQVAPHTRRAPPREASAF